jgi:hypothetical protein
VEGDHSVHELMPLQHRPEQELEQRAEEDINGESRWIARLGPGGVTVPSFPHADNLR